MQKGSAHTRRDNQRYQNLNEITENLITLGDIEILRKQIKNQIKRGLSHIDTKTIIRVLDQFSWQAFEKDFNTVFSEYKDRFNVMKALSWLCELLLAHKIMHFSIRRP